MDSEAVKEGDFRGVQMRKKTVLHLMDVIIRCGMEKAEKTPYTLGISS